MVQTSPFDSVPTAGTSPFLSNPNSAASWPTSGVKETVFGVPNNSGIDFNSKPLPFHSNSSSAGTPFLFGQPTLPNFAPGSGSSGFSSGNSNLFEGYPIAGAFGVSPNSGYGTNTSGFGLPKNTSQIFVGSPFTFHFTQAPGIQGSTGSQLTTASKGSKVSSYVPTQDGGEKILSISGMEIYKGKSHEKLRLEDYELHSKGGQSAGFKPSDSQSNIFQFPSSVNKSDDTICKPSPFEPFKPNPFAPKQQDIVTPKAFPFEAFKPNLFASDDKIIKPSPFEKFKSNPFAPKQQVLVNSDTTCKTFPVGPFKPNPFAIRSQNSVSLNDKITKPSPFAPKQQGLVTSDTTCKAFPIGPFKPNPFAVRSQNSVSVNDKIAEPSPFAPKQQDLVTSSDTTSKAFLFEPFKPNPFAVRSQNSVSVNDKIAEPSPFAPKQQDLVTTSDTNSIAVQIALFEPNPFAIIIKSQDPFTSNDKIAKPSSSEPFFNPFVPKQQDLVTPNDTNSTNSSMTAQPTSVSLSDPWPFTSQFENPIQASRASDGFTMAKEVCCQNINGQQLNLLSSTVGQQSVHAVTPFSMISPTDQPRDNGISSLPASNCLSSKKNNLSTNRSASLLRVRHVSLRKSSLPASRLICTRSDPKVTNLLSKACEKEDTPISFTEKTEAYILSLMPNLPYGEDYYTQPSLTEIASKEKDEPGSCTRVEGFVFGRTGFGSIRFFGQTNVRNLDLGSIVQFNKREVIVYGDNNKKPPVGQGLNKPAEVTLLKIKCTSKKTGKEYVDGPQVKSYREMLVKMAREQGAEFVSYDPVEGEWKFRVQSF
ncbi:nucleoporin [Striga asiatica]|uniref:Nucleoporin n=2 Tax=Striga asiatica TaxID=4170 RepID=A0A5A7P9F5_STRAF|nr:nucleoporin [Striga asiatica]